MNKRTLWVVCLIIFIGFLGFINNYLNNSSNKTNLNNNESVGKIIQVTSSNFNEVVLNSEKTVFVDFYADWCPPCKMLAPIIEEVASETPNENLVFVRVNIDDEEELANKYGIQSIPTLILIKDGKEVNRSVGYIDKSAVEEFVNQ